MSWSFHRRTIAWACCAGLWLATPVTAQQLSGSVSGIVSDSSGGVLPGATIQLLNSNTGTSTEQVAAGDGGFVFNAVRPGPYVVRASLTGFKTVTRQVVVELNKTLRVDFSLEIGDLAEVVEVTAQTSSVETVGAQVATNVNNKVINDLPNINRDITQLVELLPGARQVEGSTSGGSQVVDISGNYALGNATRRSQSLFYVDGSENMGSRRNQALQMPNPDTVEEVQVVSSSASAEFGKEPGISMNAITKSGTNQLHGTALFATHHKSLNATTWAANRAGSPKPKDDQKWMGGTLGGPIIKNKTFYFGSFQRYQDNQAGQNSTTRMPTPRMMNGDFREITGFSIKSIDPTTGQPIGTVIPSELFNPIAAQLKTRFPTIDAYNNSLRYFWQYEREVANNEYLLKIDHNLTDRQRLSGSYMTTDGEQVRPDGFPGLENQIPGWGGVGESTARQHTASVRHTWLKGQQMVVESRFAMGRLASTRTRTDLDENLATLGGKWPTVTPGVEQTLPSIFFTNGPSGRGGQLSDTVQQNYRVLSTVNWLRGSHNIKFGGEWQYSEFTRFLNYDNGQLFFTGAYSNTAAPLNGPWPALSSPAGDNTFAYAWADFLLGRTSRAVATGVSDNQMGGPAMFFFLQDDWRLHPRVTVTPGLRYELYGTQTSSATLAGYVEGHTSDQYPNAPPGLAFEGDTGIPDGFRRPDRNNVAPRIGVAWDVFGNGKLALRSGWGVYFAYPPLAMVEVLADTVGAPSFTANNGNLTDPWGTARANSGDTTCQFPNCQPPNFSSDPSLRTFTPTSINGFEEGLDTPYQYQFNVTAQYEVLGGLTVEAAYVGNRPRNGFMVFDQNLPLWTPTATEGNVNARRPNQTWRAINITDNSSEEQYDAGQFTATLRKRGIWARVIYTFQRSLATGDDEGQEVGVTNTPAAWLDNPRDPEGELARVAPRQVLRAAFAYDLPTFNAHPVTNFVLGGWQLAGNLTWIDGEHINVTIGRDWNVDSIGGDRPDQLGSIEYLRRDNGDGTSTWITNSAFANPPVPSAENPYPFGTLDRNAVRGPSRFYANAALTKNFKIAGNYRFQFRVDVNNVFNHPILSNPNMSLSSSDFGLIRTKSGGGRVMQVQFKLIF